MRSSHRLRRELALRESVDRRQHETGDNAEGWGALAHDRNVREMDRIRGELAAGGGDFEWAFDGRGVFGDKTIALSRLDQLSRPLATALRGIGKDLLNVEGPTQPKGTDLNVLAEPVVAGMFPSSFGIRLRAAPVAEQIGLFNTGATLFERTARRTIEILRAARLSTDDPEPIFDSLRGFRKSTLNALERLSGQLIQQGAPTEVRWNGESVLIVRPEHAERLLATLHQSSVVETKRTLVGELYGGNIRANTFQLDPIDEDEPDIHGTAEPDAVLAMQNITYGATVVATLRVIELHSSLLEEPKREHVLIDVQPISEA